MRLCWGGGNQNLKEWVAGDREEGKEVKAIHKSHVGAVVCLNNIIDAYNLRSNSEASQYIGKSTSFGVRHT